MTAKLNVIFGPCGAGKTTYAHAFARREKAVAFILDDWMARLFGADMPEPIEYEWMLERVGAARRRSGRSRPEPSRRARR
jgi:predicted kinase